MLTFVIRRLIGMVAVLFAVSLLVFIVFILVPGGDPAQRMAGKNPTPENIQNIREKWGFDKPFYVQYAKMMQKAANGLLPGQHSEYDILRSFDTRQNVVHEIVKGIPATFSLCIGAGIIWLVFGTLVGVISAVTAGRASDRLITTLALIGISMPVFWLGIVLRYFFAEQHTIFPDGGYVPLTSDPTQWLYHLILPWFCLAVLFIGFYGRVLRSNMLDAMGEDYVRTARAKGLYARAVIYKHALRNALIPFVTTVGIVAGYLFGGAIVVEQVFAIPGLGRLILGAIAERNYPLVQAIILVVTFSFVLLNFVVDLLYAVIDPRVRQ